MWGWMNDGKNTSPINERLMVGWHIKNPGYTNQYPLDGKLTDPVSKSAWNAIRKLGAATITTPQIVDLMAKNGAPGMTIERFTEELLKPLETWGMPDPVFTYSHVNGLWQKRNGKSIFEGYIAQMDMGKVTPMEAAEKALVETALMQADTADITSTDSWGGERAKAQHKALSQMSKDQRTARFPDILPNFHNKFKKGIIPGITTLLTDTGGGKSIFRLMLEHAWAQVHGRKVISAITESSVVMERARRLCQLNHSLVFDEIVWGEWVDKYDEILGTPYPSGGSVDYIEANGKDISWLLAVANGKDIMIDLWHDVRYNTFMKPGLNDVKAEEAAWSAMEGYCTKHGAQIFVTVQSDKASRVNARQNGIPLNAANAKGNSAYEGKSRRFLTLQYRYADADGEVEIDGVKYRWKEGDKYPMGWLSLQKNRDGGALTREIVHLTKHFEIRSIRDQLGGQETIAAKYKEYLPRIKR